MTRRELLASSERFGQASKAEQAEMLVWLAQAEGNAAGTTAAEVSDIFDELGLPLPNLSRLKAHFKKSKNIRTLANARYGATREFTKGLDQAFPESSVPDGTFELDSIALPPFVPAERKADLERMVRAYAYLFLLENSMRGLIEKVLGGHLGPDWWNTAANAGMKKKHADRVANEGAKKWAPTRSEFGPLYALDWPDLITLIRKYPTEFEPYFKEINFLHRYEDTGTFRNVVAHNGVLREDDDFELIRIYYKDWIRQLS